MKEDNLSILKKIFESVLNIEHELLSDSLRPFNYEHITKESHENWDSVAQMSLIAGIESEFNVTITSLDFDRMTSFSTIESVLTKKGL